jgi:NAD(P)-dependent dehydrogenase (short-subunit alcohol dehydrogenase family)
MTRLNGKVAIVTGGGHGIGRAIAAAYASEGASVVISGRDVARLAQTTGELAATGARVKAVKADISVEADARKLADEAVAVTGPVLPVSQMDLPAWTETLMTNVTGTMLCAREALRYMIPQKSGVIINMSSEGGRGADGRAGYPNRSAYCSSKIAIIGLTETLAVEVGQYGIRVNAISPAGVMGERIRTIMTNRAAGMGITVEELISRHVSNYSLGRMAEESEIAAVAVFLASSESSAITGQTIVANCGQHIVH